MKNRTDNQCWRRWKIISRKSSKSNKGVVDDKRFGTLGIKKIKINMEQPFTIRNKKVKMEGILHQGGPSSSLASVKAEVNMLYKEGAKRRGRKKGVTSKGKGKGKKKVEEDMDIEKS